MALSTCVPPLPSRASRQRQAALRAVAPPSALVREWRRYERMLGPAGHRVLDALRLTAGQRVLDFSCATGGLALEAAHRVGPRGTLAGIDPDPAAIAIARRRASEQLLGWASFAALDVERAQLPVAAFDAIVSRFGLGRLQNPASVIARLGAALVPGGRIAFACWAEARQNGWFSLPRDVVADCLGADAKKAIAASAQGSQRFAFCDRDALGALLAGSELQQIAIERFETPTWVGDDVDDALELFFETEGRPLDSMLDQKSVARLTQALRRALVAHERPDGVWLPAAAWVVLARSV